MHDLDRVRETRLTISSGLMTPNWISRICRTGAEEYVRVMVIVTKSIRVQWGLEVRVARHLEYRV